MATHFTKKPLSFAVYTITATLLGACLTQTAIADELSDIFTKGNLSADFRLRNEQVNQTGKEDAEANTLRSRATTKSGVFNGLSFGAQVDNVLALSSQDRYNAYPDRCGTHEYCDNARIIDPEGTEVNEAYVNYAGAPKTNLTYGRQHINLDNERFVGSVGFRQNDQTYDAFKVENKSLPLTTLTAASIYNVNRVFGEDVVSGNHKQKTMLYNAGLSVNDAFKPSLYYYDVDNRDVTTYSSKTKGVRVTGNYPKKEGDRLIYAAEYAHQTDGDNNTVSYSENYQLLEAGGELKGYQVLLGHEVLGGNANGATTDDLQTPLATLHKFNGWADMFLTTPDGGLVDNYISATKPVFGVKLTAAYHEFTRDDTSATLQKDLGNEWDLSVGKTFMKNYNLLVKYANYDSDQEVGTGNTKSTRKVLLEASAKFD